MDALFLLKLNRKSYVLYPYLRLFQTIFENSFIWRPKRLVTLLNV